MSKTSKYTQKIAHLAHLDADCEELNEDVEKIMMFVEQLQKIDTTKMNPLYSPLEMHARMRPDIASEESCLKELEEIAPMFEDDLYLVPKVIDNE